MANGLTQIGNSTDLTKLSSTLTTSSDDLEARELSARWLLDKARNLYRSFANAKDDCPEIIAKNFVTILSRFPVEIIEAVCDPMNGIPADQTFVPSPKELRDGCEKRYAPMIREREREEQIARQMEGRRADEARAKAPKTGAVARYLAERKLERQHLQGPPAAAEVILRTYTEGRAKCGNKVTLSAGARAIIEAAGLEIPS